MNIFEISNKFLTVTLSDMGGEMQSVKLLGEDRLWRGDSAFWKYHAPFLFPIVGRLNENQAVIKGGKYAMNQHGLNRIALHQMVEKSESSITFCFSSDSETLKAFPYEFELYTKYTLIGKKVEIIVTIKNKNDVALPCSVGAHPAFPIDLHEGDTLENYEVVFEDEETGLTQLLVSDAGLYCGEKACDKIQVVEIDEKSLNGTIIYKDFKSNWVSLVRKETGEKVSSFLGGHELIAFWKGDNAPFLCLEPWNGIADPDGYTGDFEKKPYIEKIDDEKSYDFSIKFE